MDVNRLWFDFCRDGTYYYVCGRSAELSGLSPVYGNLFHHALELLLKADLIRHGVPLLKVRAFGHNLGRLWKRFKKRTGDKSLAQYDPLIRELNRFQSIRYPEQRGGMTIATSIVPGQRATMWSDTPLPPHYEINLGEMDELVMRVVKAVEVNPTSLRHHLLSEESKRILLEQNLQAGFWTQD